MPTLALYILHIGVKLVKLIEINIFEGLVFFLLCFVKSFEMFSRFHMGECSFKAISGDRLPEFAFVKSLSKRYRHTTSQSELKANQERRTRSGLNTYAYAI
jgi:hypothetical protein